MRYLCFPCSPDTAFKPRFGSNQGYLSTEEIGVFINETVDRLPSNFTRVERIGASVQGQPILALCVGACHVDGAPQALYTGMHHSREVPLCNAHCDDGSYCTLSKLIAVFVSLCVSVANFYDGEFA